MGGTVVLVSRVHGYIQGLFDLVGRVHCDRVGIWRQPGVTHIVVESVLLNEGGVPVILA